MQHLALSCLLMLAPAACSQVLIRQLLQMAQLQSRRSKGSSLLLGLLLHKAVSLLPPSLVVVLLLVLVQQQPTVYSMLAELIQLQLPSNRPQMQLAAVGLVQCLILRELLLSQTWPLVHKQQVPQAIQLQGPPASALELQQAWLQAAVQHSLLASASVSLLAVVLDSSVMHQAALLSPAPEQLTARLQLGIKACQGVSRPLDFRHPVQQVPPVQQT